MAESRIFIDKHLNLYTAKINQLKKIMEKECPAVDFSK